MATETKQTGVCINTWAPPELAEKVQAAAKAEQRTVAQIVRLCLEHQFAEGAK